MMIKPKRCIPDAGIFGNSKRDVRRELRDAFDGKLPSYRDYVPVPPMSGDFEFDRKWRELRAAVARLGLMRAISEGGEEGWYDGRDVYGSATRAANLHWV